MYHVFADVGEWRAGRLLAAPSSDPLRVEALAVETPDGARHLLVACLAPEAVTVVLTGLVDGPVRVRRLEAATAPRAMSDPAAFRAGFAEAAVSKGRLSLELAPYGVARIDIDGRVGRRPPRP